MFLEIDTPGCKCSISPLCDQEKRILPLKRERSESSPWSLSDDDDAICALETEEEELIQEIKALRAQAGEMKRQVRAATAQLQELNSLVELLHRRSLSTLPHSPSKKSRRDESVG